MHAAHAFNARHPVKQELLVGIHVWHHHLEQVVRFLAGDQVALLHLGKLTDAPLEILETLRRMPVHADLDDHGEIEPERLAVEQGGAADDNPGVLQRLDPARAGRRRQPDTLGQFEVGKAAVVLQCGKDAAVDLVEFVRTSWHISNNLPYNGIK